MQNFRKIQWIVIENFPDARTDGRTRVNSKVPIPTKVGGPTKVVILSALLHKMNQFLVRANIVTRFTFPEVFTVILFDDVISWPFP